MSPRRSGTPVELTAAIEQIRVQLATAMEMGKGAPLAFRPGPFGVKAYVLSIGAKGEMSRGVTNRVKISLTPVSPTGDDILIGSVGDR